jgi:hypothetical protein
LIPFKNLNGDSNIMIHKTIKIKKNEKNQNKNKKRKIKNIYKRVDQKSLGGIPLESLAIHCESVWMSLQIM